MTRPCFPAGASVKPIVEKSNAEPGSISSSGWSGIHSDPALMMTGALDVVVWSLVASVGDMEWLFRAGRSSRGNKEKHHFQKETCPYGACPKTIALGHFVARFVEFEPLSTKWPDKVCDKFDSSRSLG